MEPSRSESEGNVSFLNDIAKIGKAVLKSPVTKVVAGGVAVVFPPVGVPALAGIAVAEKVVDATDKGVKIQNAVRAAQGGLAQIPGGRSPFAAVIGRAQLNSPAAKQALAAAQLVKNTAMAAKSDPNARHALQVMKVVKAAKQGNPMAVKSLHGFVKKQIASTLLAGKKPNATAQEKTTARLVTGVIQATAARKKASRKYGVDRRTMRVVRVA